MTAVAFCSAKGSPGVTTTVLALQHIWPDASPGRRVLVVDADPAGGAIAAGYLQGQPVDRGLVDLALTRSRDPVDAVLGAVVSLDETAERLLLVGVTDPYRAAAATGAYSVLSAALDGLGGQVPPLDVLVDLGRLGVDSDVAALRRSTNHVVLVTSSSLQAVVSARAAAGFLNTDNGPGVSCLVVGPGRPYPGGEVAEAIGVPLLGELPYDPTAAAVFSNGAAFTRSTARSALLRGARAVAAALPTAELGITLRVGVPGA